MSLIAKMLKTGSNKSANVLSKSSLLTAKDMVQTELPILNVAFSASLKGGLMPGLTVVAGESKSFKTMLTLFCMKSYLDKYEDGIALFYDSEFGVTADYLESFGIDTDRVVHLPINDVEELKFDILQKLQAIEKGERVFIAIDSIGNLASKKEVEDAANEKSVADMSRAKSLKSLFRIVTPYLTTKAIPCVAINHIYKEIGMFPKNIVSGGTGIYYSANQIFIITRAQESKGQGSDKELLGYKFTINVEKSRLVKEKSKLPFTVLYEGGIQKWSGLFELAEEAGFIQNPKKGWYQLIDPDTGEVSEKNYREKDVMTNEEFFEKLVASDMFNAFIVGKYKLAGSMNREEESSDLEDDDFDNED
jgi:RecA/RadA recombinase